MTGAPGLGDGEGLSEGLTLELADADTEALALELGETEGDTDTLSEDEGLTEEDGETEGLPGGTEGESEDEGE